MLIDPPTAASPPPVTVPAGGVARPPAAPSVSLRGCRRTRRRNRLKVVARARGERPGGPLGWAIHPSHSSAAMGSHDRVRLDPAGGTRPFRSVAGEPWDGESALTIGEQYTDESGGQRSPDRQAIEVGTRPSFRRCWSPPRCRPWRRLTGIVLDRKWLRLMSIRHARSDQCDTTPSERGIGTALLMLTLKFLAPEKPKVKWDFMPFG